MKRPAIITILSLLHYLIGTILLYLTIDEIVMYLIYKTVGTQAIPNLPFNIPNITGDYPYLIVITLYGLLSFISFYTGYGLWKGWNWIWYLEIGLNFIVILNILFLSIASNFLGIGLISIVNIMIIYFLRKEDVKNYFRLEN